MERYYPKVTIGIPVYGVEMYMERCARSLMEQTYPNIEYIFVNDCTKDRSIDILKEVISKYPEKTVCVKIIDHERNRGLAAARNTVIDNCTGDFITWVDSDDWVDKDMVKYAVEEQFRGDFDIVSFGSIWHYGKKQKYHSSFRFADAHDMCLRMIFTDFHVWGRIIRTSLYKENGIRVLEGANIAEDHQQMPRLAYFAKKVSVIDDFLYHYECSNQAAYTCRGMSPEKAEQRARSTGVLYEFFEGRGEEYMRALNDNKTMRLIGRLIEWDSVDREDLDYLRGQRDEVSRFSLFHRPFLLMDNVTMLHLYSVLYRFMKGITGNDKY